MRILAIRGGGLASLAQPFEIDLTQEPLAGTGLFAITGETGAGKSTILDALCLALYGDYPRAAIDKREKVNDPSEVVLQASDPRNILTRGAGAGHAEVDFIGVDGVAYRATWAVRRAKNKPTGRLQAVERKLERCDGTATVATSIEPVKAAVIEKSGFTFEEFRRSVLLAQGEFDAFLLADEAQRAALLEKITGTELYSRISMQVFATTAERQHQLDLLAAQRQAIDLRPESDLAVERAEEAAAIAAQGTAEAERQQVDAVLAAASELARLGRAAAERSREVEEAGRAVHEAGTALEQAEQARDDEASALGRIDAEIAELEPLWQEAARLDDRLSDAGQRCAAATEALKDARGAEAAAKERLAALDGERHSAEEQQATALVALARDAAHAVLAEQEARFVAGLKAYAGLALRFETTREEARRAEVEIERLTASIAHSEAALAADRSERTRIADLVAARRTALEAIDDPALSLREADLLAADADIGQALEAVRERDRGDAVLASARTEAQAASAEEATQGRRATEVRAALQERARAREELSQLCDMADATLSTAATTMRSVLIEGQACPVCGALEHPFAHADDTATALARDIKHRRTVLDHEIAALTETLTEAETARSRAAGAVRQALDTIAAAEPHLAEVQSRLTLRHAGLVRHAVLLGTAAAMPDDAGALTAATLEAVRAAWAATRRSVSDARGQARALHAEIEELRKAEARVADRIEEAVVAGDAERQALAGLAGAATARRDRVADLREEMAGALDELAPALAAAAMTASDVERDVAAARQRLQMLAGSYRDQIAERDRVAERLARLKGAIDLAANDLSHASANLARAEEQDTLCRAGAEQVRTARSALLGGVATEPHRQAALARQSAAREAMQTAAEAVVQAKLALARAQSGAAAAAKAEEWATAAAAAAAVRLEHAAIVAGAEPATVERLRAEVPEALSGFAERRHRLDQSIDAAKARLVLIADARARDAEAREKSVRLAADYDAKAEDHAIWQAVNAAIGQADGAKFRRFAQSFTLDHLIDLANLQIAALSPRYRLRRSTLADLALDVVDRDMGDEIRSPRSLSGGERFLVALALALALSRLEGRQTFVDTLFIDEGFGSLDGDTIDLAIGALESLQGQGRKVGVITHVAAMVEQIAVQVKVEKRGSGRSVVRIVDGGAGTF